MMIHVSETLLSDLYKDANGFRPRNYYKEWWTKTELQDEYDHLSRICKENMERESIEKTANLKSFDNLIKETINMGAADRETAIRWLIDGENLDINHFQDVEHFFWLQGLSYEKITEFSKIILDNLS